LLPPCTKFDLGLGSDPYHTLGGIYSAPPDPLAGFKEPTSKGGRGGEGEEGGEGRGNEKGKVIEGKWKGGDNVPLALILQFDHWPYF